MICRYYLTYSCDCQCEFCKIWLDEEIQDAGNADPDNVFRNIFSLAKLGCKKIVFTGGEPLLHPDLVRIMKAAKHYRMRTVLYTDGLHFSGMAAELKDVTDDLYISIDAPEAEEHDRIRGQECFAEACDSLEAAKKLGMDPVINFTVTRDSITYLPEMEEFAEKKGVMLNINPVNDCFGLMGFEKGSIDYLLRYSCKGHILIDRAAFEVVRDGGNDPKRPVCAAMSEIITITPDDHILLPCPSLSSSKVPISGELEKVYRSDIVKGYRSVQGRTPKCSGCMDMDYILPSIRSKIWNRYSGADLLSRAENAYKRSKGDIKKAWTYFTQ